ncbi:MAG: hypothetical protein LBL80_05930, partial [Ruminococcus sp.]|nr:hypothetical protein [Ruminococcus sp.]
NYYITKWNPGFSGDTDELNHKLSRAGDIISNNINKLDFFDVPYYLLEDVKKAVCVQADSIKESTAGASYRIGKFSVTTDKEFSSGKNILCDAAKLYLYNTGLLLSTAVVA